MKKITLSKLIKKYYNELDYLGTQYNYKHKQFIQVNNKEFARILTKCYSNLKLIRTTSQFAPEIHKYFITLK